jgi:hypothetical protein
MYAKTVSAAVIKPSLLPLPSIGGVIERRMLINFRCNPEILATRLPHPFRPKLVGGWGLAGICLIRLELMPPFVRWPHGFRSENAAHRIAVEWDEDGSHREGVFIPRRDTNSTLNRIAGGRIFPGLHHPARFRVVETGERYQLEMLSRDGLIRVFVKARLSEALSEGSVFRSLTDASAFFRGGSNGWSPGRRGGCFEGLELRADQWKMFPLDVECVESSFFDNGLLFPKGTATFDSACLMRDIPHSWHGCGQLVAADKEDR